MSGLEPLELLSKFNLCTCYIGEVVAKVIRILYPWCREDLLPIAKELIWLDWEVRRFDRAADILLAILCCSLIHNDDVELPADRPGLPLDDSSLAALLELVSSHSCSKLVDTAAELLEERAWDYGMNITPLTLPCSSKNYTLDASTLLVKSLLGSVPPSQKFALQSEKLIPFQSVDTVPFCSRKDSVPSLASTLSCLESSEEPTDLDLPPFLLNEDCVCRLVKFCVETMTLPCANMLRVLLVCDGDSCYVQKCLALSLRDVCTSASLGNEEALTVLKDYLPGCEDGKDLKMIQKLVLDSCVKVLHSGVRPYALQVLKHSSTLV